MKACQFSCPHCSALLRVRDRTFVGAEISCPDCAGPMRLVAHGRDEVSAQAPAGMSPASRVRSPVPELAAAGGRLWLSTLNSRLSTFCAVLQTPVGIAWSVAGVFGLALFVAVNPFGIGERPAESSRLAVADEPVAHVATAGNRQDEVDANAAVAASDAPRAGEGEPRTGHDEPRQNIAPAAQADIGDASPSPLPAAARPVPSPPIDGDPPADVELRIVAGPRPAQAQPLPELKQPAPDPAAPNEAGDRPKSAAGHKPDSTEPAVPPPDAVVVVAPVEKAEVDIRQALAQPILRFRQAEAASLASLLSQLEEMAGVPIRIDATTLPEGLLEQQVSLDLESTSIAGILEALLKKAGLTHEIRKDAVHVKRAGSGQ